MPSVITDRSSGVGSGTTPNGQNATISMKVPVKAATTANITLSGAQTIDGVSITAGHRVLVKDQDTASENGIYVAATGAWSRAVDCADDGDLVSGTMVRVNSGTQLGLWYCSSADPINIGSDNIAWTVATEGDMLKSVYDSDDDGQVESADAASAVAWDDVTGKPSTFAPSTHTHDDRYYTETEADALLSALDTAAQGYADDAETAAKAYADSLGGGGPRTVVAFAEAAIADASRNSTTTLATFVHTAAAGTNRIRFSLGGKLSLSWGGGTNGSGTLAITLKKDGTDVTEFMDARYKLSSSVVDYNEIDHNPFIDVAAGDTSSHTWTIVFTSSNSNLSGVTEVMFAELMEYVPQ